MDSPDRITQKNRPCQQHQADTVGRSTSVLLKPGEGLPSVKNPVRAWPLSHVTPPVRTLTGVPAMIRSHVRVILAEWEMPDLSDSAELVASELVTNVVLAAAPEEQDARPDAPAPVFQVGLFSDRTTLLIEVFDTVQGEPKRREATITDENGRGLAIVEALSQTWGTRPHPRGKVVYARLQAA